MRLSSRLKKIIAGAAALLLLVALLFGIQRIRGGLSKSGTPAASRRQLVLAVDGLSWETFQEARKRGLFKRFRYSAKHIAPYPSMSHPSWTEIMGTRRLFGDRGNAHTVESRWFDLEAMRTANDPRQVIARQNSPYNYQRGFDYFFNPLIEPVMYLRGEKVFNRELEEAESAILNEFTGDKYIAYIAGPDAMGHTHLNGLWNYVSRLDSTINLVADSLSARGNPPEIWLVSDHGNAAGFVEGGPENYLTTFSLDSAIKQAGLTRADTGSLTRDDQVAVVTIALATMVNVYFADLEKRRQLANVALRDPAVELATWLEVRGRDKYVVVRGPGDSEARVRWQRGSYSYESIAGNPLLIPDSLISSAQRTIWITDKVSRAATADGHYPDALFRIVQSATKSVENAPDMIVNLHDGFCYKGDLGQFVRMVRTHGSLSARSSLGILASTSSPLPSNVRGEEILGIIGLSPVKLFERFAGLASRSADSVIANAEASNHWISTGRQDDSRQISFLRRARVIAASMDYFAYDVMRAVFRDIRSKTKPGATPSQLDKTRSAIKRADIIGGVTNNVDTLLALVDSLDIKEMPARLRTAEQRVKGIPKLAPLGDIRSAWKTDSAATGGGESARRLTMATWTLPYFLDDALYAAEEDSIPDPRDLKFARDWTHKERASSGSASISMDDTVAPRKLFSEVFQERKLIRKVEPEPVSLFYDPHLEGVTVVYVPGIYGELFDQEIWSRGMRSVRDRLGVRTLSLPVDGRCSSELNSAEIINALRTDTRRRVERGYDVPRYLMIGYSKGGIDASQALLLAPDLVRKQIVGLVTLATPHNGSPVAERTDIPGNLLRWGIASAPPARCDTSGSSRALWASTRAAFWSEQGEKLPGITRFYSVSFVSEMESAHPWMKLTKRIGEFSEPNDGVVALSSSRFPAFVHAVDFGIVDGDHIAGRLASSFPQDAFLEAVVITVAELGGLDARRTDAWVREVSERNRISSQAESKRSSRRVPHFPSSLRPPEPLPGGSTGWKPETTFSATRPIDPGGRTIRLLSPATDPRGVSFRCDQSDMLAFRREYEFYYDSSNGGSEDDFSNGFSIVASPGSPGGRACHLATNATAIKMTTASFQFRPVDFPLLQMRFRVVKDLTGVDAGKERRGKSDAALKMWLVLEDTRPEKRGQRYMFGYWWTGRDIAGHSPPPDSLVEALSSRRNLVFSTLPEAWLISMGTPDQVGKWQTLERNLSADIRRAFPGVPAAALKVVGITFQSDSDASRESTEVFLEGMTVQRLSSRK